MKTLLLLVVLTCSFPFYSQIKISGHVFDKETQKGIPDVVVFCNNGKVLSQTDTNGRYSLEIPSTGFMYFQHLAYNMDSIPVDSAKLSYDIVLAPHVVGLKEVVISPDYTNKLLLIAFSNLIERLDTKQSRQYLFHNKEHTTLGGEREAYSLVDVELKKVNVRRGRTDWGLNLILADRMQQGNQESFYMGGKPFFVELLLRSFDSKLDYSNYYCERKEENGNLLTIKISPKHPDKDQYRYRIYTIDLTDTVLIEIISQSFLNSAELTKQKYKGIDWNISSSFSLIQFEQESISSKFFIAETQFMGTAQIGSGASTYNLFFNSSQEIWKRGIVAAKSKKKRIKPYNFAIFECEFEDTPGFWK